MARGILTKLRRKFIIKTLLDGNEWHTQEILKRIGDLEFYYYCYEQNGIWTNPGEIKFKPENVEPVNNPKLSLILGNLVKEGLIETRALSRFEKDGNVGSRGNVYWLANDKKVLYSILKELVPYPFVQFDILLSEYGKKLINLNLVNELIKTLNPLWTEKDKEFILAILQTSPTAVYESLKAYYIEDSYWFKYMAPKSSDEIRLIMKEKFLMDLKFWLYNDMQTTPLRGRPDLRLTFDVSVSITNNNNEIKNESQIESLDIPVYPTEEQYLEKIQFDKEHKPIKLYELENRKEMYENTKEFLKRYVYDSLREISEEKGEEKKQKKEKLIKEYYIIRTNLEKKLISINRKFYHMNQKYVDELHSFRNES